MTLEQIKHLASLQAAKDKRNRRDLFAAHAMGGLLAHPSDDEGAWIINASVKYADDLIAALDRVLPNGSISRDVLPDISSPSNNRADGNGEGSPLP